MTEGVRPYLQDQRRDWFQHIYLVINVLYDLSFKIKGEIGSSICTMKSMCCMTEGVRPELQDQRRDWLQQLYHVITVLYDLSFKIKGEIGSSICTI